MSRQMCLRFVVLAVNSKPAPGRHPRFISVDPVCCGCMLPDV